MMKKLLPALVVFMISAFAPAAAQQNADIVTIESHSVFKGVLLEVWGRLKALNPSSRQTARSTVTYTAGIRGSEATDTLLQPYWKDDLTQNAEFQAELGQYGAAQELMDAGDMQAAVAGFEQFLKDHDSSLLRPNALFAKSLCHAGLGESEQAKSSLQAFLAENPDHPLADDAQAVVNTL